MAAGIASAVAKAPTHEEFIRANCPSSHSDAGRIERLTDVSRCPSSMSIPSDAISVVMSGRDASASHRHRFVSRRTRQALVRLASEAVFIDVGSRYPGVRAPAPQGYVDADACRGGRPHRADLRRCRQRSSWTCAHFRMVTTAPAQLRAIQRIPHLTVRMPIASPFSIIFARLPRAAPRSIGIGPPGSNASRARTCRACTEMRSIAELEGGRTRTDLRRRRHPSVSSACTAWTPPSIVSSSTREMRFIPGTSPRAPFSARIRARAGSPSTASAALSVEQRPAN